MFNLQGSEIIVILLLALVVLGPEKLPDAIRRFTKTYNELKKMGTGFQTEFRDAMEEPVRELRQTAEMVRDAADPDKIAASATQEVEERAQVEQPAVQPTESVQSANGATPQDDAASSDRMSDSTSNTAAETPANTPIPTPPPPFSSMGVPPAPAPAADGHVLAGDPLAPPSPDERPTRLAPPWKPETS